MKYTKKTLILLSALFSLILALSFMACAACWVGLHYFDGFCPISVSAGEFQQRQQLISTAQTWLGTTEESTSHHQILQIYNTHEPLAVGYEVKPEDNWCATFCSCAAIQTGLTEIIPTECSCGRQIDLWVALERWEEDDKYLPLAGDYIYYNWDKTWNLKDNTGWADHVGIVVGTAGPAIKVIEGNRDDCVTYRVIFRWNRWIRGYGLPDFASIE